MEIAGAQKSADGTSPVAVRVLLPSPFWQEPVYWVR